VEKVKHSTQFSSVFNTSIAKLDPLAVILSFLVSLYLKWLDCTG